VQVAAAPENGGDFTVRWIRAAATSLCALALVGPAPPHARPHARSTPHPRPYVSGAPPKPPGNLRRRNSIVVDVDFEESAAAITRDVIDITGTIQLILDRIAAETAPFNDFGEARPIVWVSLTPDKECRNSTDAAILEVRVARFIGRTFNYVVVGRQVEEANLAFRLYDCSGREILHYPRDESSPYGLARFAPYYLSVTGSVSVVALANAHSNNSSIAAVLGVLNGYSPLQANIGAHDPNALRLLALFRLMGNIPGTNVPPPTPGTVSALLQSCAFGADPDGVIRLHCAPRPTPTPTRWEDGIAPKD
jgi:hypothetical protein